MIFVIGGYAQGMDEYAQEKFGKENILIEDLNDFVKKSEKDEMGIKQELLELFEINPDKVVIGTEVGCGIVPIDKEDRMQRDRIGHIQIFVASKADEVYRVICGIPAKIK